MSTYSTSLKLTLIGDGEQSGTWGQTTNTNLGTLLEQAITGVVTIVHPDTATYSLTNLNGVSDEARNAVLVITGALTAQRDVIAPAVKKLYTIKNSTTGGYAIRIKTSGGTAVTVPNGFVIGVYCDGPDFYVQQNGIVGPFAVTGNATVVGTLGVVGALSGSTAAFSGAISSVSPTFTGTPTVPTAANGTNTTQAASTAFVQAAITGGIGGLGTMSTQNANNVNITGGSVTGVTLASGNASFTGTPTAPTAAANTNTTQLATTAFVLGQGNTTAGTIAMNGVQAAGTSNLYARADHIHPTDTSRAPTASPAFTGTPTAPTAAGGTNTTQIATTAFVTTAVSNATGALGTMSTQNANNVNITGGSITGITDLAVADGGTGASSITANSVILGNGTSALSGNLVAPSTSGNVLTSNGTTWQSTANSYIGVGQTWQDVGGSRSLGVNYTNSTGKPIMVAVTTSNYFSYTYIYVNGSNIGYSYDADFGGRNLHTFIVPNGSTYQAAGSSSNTVLQLWWELR